MEQDLTTEIFLRPRFSMPIEEDQEVLLSKFKSKLNDEQCDYGGKIVGQHIFLDIPQDESRYYSPQLHVELLEEKKGETLLKGLFGPRPQVWTLFMFFHFVVGGLFLTFSVVWYVQWSLDANTFLAKLITIISPILWIGLYVFGRLSRNRGKHQAEQLYDFLMEILEK